MGEKAVPPGLQLGAQFDEIVDLAVGDQSQLTIRRPQWLMPTGQVDDRQPGVPHAEVAMDEGPLVIGTAMGQARHPPLQGLPIHRGLSLVKPDDTAHGLISRDDDAEALSPFGNVSPRRNFLRECCSGAEARPRP